MANMEHNGGNQNMGPLATLCRMGCGFYGNSTFDGMCSKCYKDVMKRRQQNTSPTQTSVSSGRMSPAVSAASAIAEVVSSSTDTGPTSSLTITSSSSSVSSNGSSSVSGGSSMVTSTTPSIDTATPTVPSALPSDNTHDKDELAEGGAEVSTENKDKESGDKDKKPKKNRCHTCKKKVGLTGFECRCGGLYCGLHRYSDKHNCTFNYKEMAQEQIRKNNPVVVGQKIQKI